MTFLLFSYLAKIIKFPHFYVVVDIDVDTAALMLILMLTLMLRFLMILMLVLNFDQIFEADFGQSF